MGPVIPKEMKCNLHYGDVRGDVPLPPPSPPPPNPHTHGTNTSNRVLGIASYLTKLSAIQEQKMSELLGTSNLSNLSLHEAVSEVFTLKGQSHIFFSFLPSEKNFTLGQNFLPNVVCYLALDQTPFR